VIRLSVAVAGTTTLSAGAFHDIILSRSERFRRGSGIVQWKHVSLRDVNAIDLGALGCVGHFAVVAGEISDSGTLDSAHTRRASSRGRSSYHPRSKWQHLQRTGDVSFDWVS